MSITKSRSETDLLGCLDPKLFADLYEGAKKQHEEETVSQLKEVHSIIGSLLAGAQQAEAIQSIRNIRLGEVETLIKRIGKWIERFYELHYECMTFQKCELSPEFPNAVLSKRIPPEIESERAALEQKIRDPDFWFKVPQIDLNLRRFHNRSDGLYESLASEAKRDIDSRVELCLGMLPEAITTINKEIARRARIDSVKLSNETAEVIPAKQERFDIQQVTRAEIIRAAGIKTYPDFHDCEKVKHLCELMDDAKIPVPQRKKGGPHGFQPTTWKEIAEKGSKSDQYKRLFKTRNSPLLKDLYTHQK